MGLLRLSHNAESVSMGIEEPPKRSLLNNPRKADQKQDYLFNLLNALHLLRKAWEGVKPETIKNCFRHAAFNEESPTEEEHFAVDELLLAWARLQDLDGINEEAEMFEYMHVEYDVVTAILKTVVRKTDKII
uniref:DDE-1 domain-containing protein n=1 Tax=Ditylenchus dipsaci TaxID=166011 RepID=A0A915EM16_9BILA